MRINARLKSKKINTKILRDLKNLETKINAGYPAKSQASNEKDLNGATVLEKAYEINFSNKNYTPYLQNSYNNNIIKYKKEFVKIAKSKATKQIKKLDKLGEEMVNDIKEEISRTQTTPSSPNQGCIYGSVSFERKNK